MSQIWSVLSSFCFFLSCIPPFLSYFNMIMIIIVYGVVFVGYLFFRLQVVIWSLPSVIPAILCVVFVNTGSYPPIAPSASGAVASMGFQDSMSQVGGLLNEQKSEFTCR